jgi:hypothetical protein
MASSFPEELRARAQLPGMTLELRHRAASPGAPEAIGIVLTGQPHLPEAAFNPLGAWLAFQRRLWAPWLALWGVGLPDRRDGT